VDSVQRGFLLLFFLIHLPAATQGPYKMESSTKKSTVKREIVFDGVYIPSQPSTPDKDGFNASYSTPNKARKSSTNTSPASASSSKHKREKDNKLSSLSKKRTAGSKWSAWEEQQIKQSIVVNGEVGTNWHNILAQINDKRSLDQARTMSSLKQHWTVAMRAKMME
jgi:hypothetical protein